MRLGRITFNGVMLSNGATDQRWRWMLGEIRTANLEFGGRSGMVARLQG